MMPFECNAHEYQLAVRLFIFQIGMI